MEISPEIREEACKRICKKIAQSDSGSGMAVEWGVIVFSKLRRGTFTYSAIETVAELLIEIEALRSRAA